MSATEHSFRLTRCQNPEFLVLIMITLYDLNPFQVNVPQQNLVTIAHLKVWGCGAFYSALFTVKEIMSIKHLLSGGNPANYDGRSDVRSQAN
jgi:hypothetical protein